MSPALVISFTLLVSLAAPAAAADPSPPDRADTFRTAEGCWQRLPLDASMLDGAEPLPFGAAVPCPGIRPGAFVEIVGVTSCTLNFVFRGTSYDDEGRPVDEGLFMGTAGHCLRDPEGEQTWAPGTGLVAADDSGRRWGESAYFVLKNASETNPMNLDFGLFRVDDDREADVNPGLCHFGGPDGTSTTWDRGDVVHHFGQGLVYGETVQGRSGVVDYPKGEGSAVIFTGTATPGDSGSPLIDADGNALGVVTAILPPLVFSTPIEMQVELAEAALDMDLELVEAPFV